MKLADHDINAPHRMDHIKLRTRYENILLTDFVILCPSNTGATSLQHDINEAQTIENLKLVAFSMKMSACMRPSLIFVNSVLGFVFTLGLRTNRPTNTQANIAIA